eukprot:Amastigsp_a56_1447.p2 type:complete len:229 gc:universal Amastigsp_a56_1447:557-1243(+)
MRLGKDKHDPDELDNGDRQRAKGDRAEVVAERIPDRGDQRPMDPRALGKVMMRRGPCHADRAEREQKLDNPEPAEEMVRLKTAQRRVGDILKEPQRLARVQRGGAEPRGGRRAEVKKDNDPSGNEPGEKHKNHKRKKQHAGNVAESARGLFDDDERQFDARAHENEREEHEHKEQRKHAADAEEHDVVPLLPRRRVALDAVNLVLRLGAVAVVEAEESARPERKEHHE